MRLEKWEPTILEILAEVNLEARESGQQRVLSRWRTKLEKGQPPVPAYQIDEIVREVRRRLPKQQKPHAVNLLRSAS